MNRKTIFASILAALLCGAILASSFAGCTQAEAKTDSTVIVEETKTEKEEEEIVRTLFSKPLLEAYEDAFQTHVTATTESVLQAMKDKTLVDNTAEVIPVFTKETLEEELADIEERANTLEMRLARDNEEFYCRWRDDQILKLSAEISAEYAAWLAEQKADEAEAKAKAEEEAAKKAAEEAAKKAEEEAAQQQPSGGSGTTGGGGSTSGGSTGGSSNNYVPPAPQPDPAPQPEPEPPAPQPDPEPDYTPPSEPSGGGGYWDSWGDNADGWVVGGGDHSGEDWTVVTG